MQIEKEVLDGLIEAAKSGVRAPDLSKDDDTPLRQDLTGTSEGSSDKKFIWEGATWTISFAGERCTLPQMVGLEYVSVLLRHPGKRLRALELQALATGTTPPGYLQDNAGRNRFDNQDTPPENQKSLHDELIDGTAMRQIKERMQQLENEIALRGGSGNTQQSDELQKELAQIRSYLKNSRNIRGRSRPFTDENDRARQSISKALVRAYELIRKQAPQTANHFETQISKGSEFTYRDATARWDLRRRLNT
jgi:hypothetical protein